MDASSLARRGTFAFCLLGLLALGLTGCAEDGTPNGIEILPVSENLPPPPVAMAPHEISISAPKHSVHVAKSAVAVQPSAARSLVRHPRARKASDHPHALCAVAEPALAVVVPKAALVPTPPSSTPTVPATPPAVVVPEETDDATAVCSDGTMSYAQHHQGACSHHGGVKVWLR